MAKGKTGRKSKNKDPTWHPKSGMKRKTGRVVSENHPFKLWGQAVAEAKKKLKVTKTFGIKKGTPVYKEAKKIHEELKKKAKKKN